VVEGRTGKENERKVGDMGRGREWWNEETV
jgi:hypothetical protein